jgi:acylphosphatase
VKNTSDGKVAGEVQGDEDGVRKLLKDINDGPRHAKVVKLEKTEIEVKEGETSFEVVGPLYS